MRLLAVLAYLERVTHFEPNALRPLWLAGHQLGWVNAEWRQRLLTHETSLFSENAAGVVCRVVGNYQHLSSLLRQAALRWRAAGWLNAWRNENFQMCLDGEPLFELERAAFRPLGLTSHAVHLNGLVHLADGQIGMWVGRRSPHKSVDPDRMDNMVGGGVAAGESIDIARERESFEEAGLPAALVRPLPEVALILAERAVQRGLHREWLHVFDLWLPPDMQPCNQDGEVAEHCCLPLAGVEDLLLGERFMIDAALVVADCMARHGYWGAGSQQVLDCLHGSRSVRPRCQPGGDCWLALTGVT